MKTHAFVRENIPKVLAYKEEGMFLNEEFFHVDLCLVWLCIKNSLNYR